MECHKHHNPFPKFWTHPSKQNTDVGPQIAKALPLNLMIGECETQTAQQTTEESQTKINGDASMCATLKLV